jgi:hypothetical protein
MVWLERAGAPSSLASGASALEEQVRQRAARQAEGSPLDGVVLGGYGRTWLR